MRRRKPSDDEKDDKAEDVSPTQVSASSSNDRVWQPPDVPFVEFLFCTLFFCANIAFALYKCVEYTSLYKSGLTSIRSPITGVARDATNFEWDLYLAAAPAYIGLLAANTLLLAVTDLCGVGQDRQRVLLIVYSLAGHCWLFSVSATLLVCATGYATALVTSRLRSPLLVWVLALLCLKQVLWLCDDEHDTLMYIKLLLYTYKTLSMISYSTWLCRQQQPPAPGSLLLNWLHFSLYLPYTCLLIVRYEDFDRQWQGRRLRPREPLAHSIGRCLRLAVWALVYELAMSAIYTNRFMLDTLFLRSCAVEYVISIAPVAAISFYVKYYLMFGVSGCAAHLDNMCPPGSPICPLRQNLFSYIWRYFDRGLYQFLKHEVYKPVIGGAFTMWRKLGAVCMCYAFVCCWHGVDDRHIRWVVLSCVEVLLERLAMWLYAQPRVHTALHLNLSEHWLRRLLMLLQDVNDCLALFGLFHFLGGPDVGRVIAQRTWWTLGPALDPMFFYLLFLGYCWNTMCLQINKKVPY